MARESLDEFEPAEEPTLKIAEKQESTRSGIAVIFIVAYLIIVLVLVFFTTFFGLKPDSVKDFLLAIGSPLGFIIGYYFKSRDS